MKQTKILNIDYDPDDVWYINTPQGRLDNNGYSAPFPLWWSKFNLHGDGYLIGETKLQGEWIAKKLRSEYPIDRVRSVDKMIADVNMDITKSLLPGPADFIFCMAVLEHVNDPGSAIKYMSTALRNNGLLFISVPGNGFKQHRRPIDCYRFLEDSMRAFADIGNLDLLDYAHLVEWCAIYKKG